MDVARILQVLRSELAQSDDPIALAGAFALNAHGLGRATADLDLVVPQSAQPRIIALLEGLGFETLHLSEGFSNHLHPDPRWGRLDFIYLDARTAERLFAACQRTIVAGQEVLVPKPVHLIAMKVQAIKNDPSRRLRDLADIQYLLALPGVEQGEARRYFDRAGLMSDWEEVTRGR